MSRSLSPIFSSNSFMASDLIFKSLILGLREQAWHWGCWGSRPMGAGLEAGSVGPCLVLGKIKDLGTEASGAGLALVCTWFWGPRVSWCAFLSPSPPWERCFSPGAAAQVWLGKGHGVSMKQSFLSSSLCLFLFLCSTGATISHLESLFSCVGSCLN